jgi:phospholipid transport system substrate-binding protein
MITRRLLLGTIAALALGTARGAVAAAPEQAKAFINDMANDAITLMARKDLPGPERTQKFRDLFIRGFDVEAIGRFVLGRYWRDATEAEQGEYLKLFEDLIVATYAGRFSEYSGETLTVLDARPDDDRFVLVSSQINRSGGNPPIRLDWRIADSQGALRIVDVVVEGVSMSVTQRSEFASVIQRSGGKVQGLIAALREKTKTLQTTTR